jgi:filamentous hemagglutinin family protein
VATTLLSSFLRLLSADRLFQISLSSLGYLILSSDVSFAQVTSDGTVNTQVNQNGNAAEITGGETRGDNLFHSFQDFSVSTGDAASFLNANDIANIFSRVTGGNISNIDGLISANGSANLFLINPAGIIFGENARLDVGGSFYGSTADSILFEDGEFSATDLNNPPVLTINAPIGLNFRDQPADIVNRSTVLNDAGDEFIGLSVAPGNNLAFVGGDIKFEGGNLTASGGNIELGGLTEAGIVSINPDGSLSFPGDVTKADINLSNAADVDVTGTGGGSVTVNARNLNLTSGEFGDSFIRAGIRSESTNPEAQAGDVTIDVAENITLDGGAISNQVNSNEESSSVGLGNSGNITINTGSLEALNGGFIDASSFGQGDAGAVNITATENITIDGESLDGFSTGVTSSVATGAEGDAGGVTITTTNLNLTNGGSVSASSFGRGDAGAVNVTASGDIAIDGISSSGFATGVTSFVATDAEGNAGGVTISTTNLNLSNGGSVTASTFGRGDAGAVNVTASGDIAIDGKSSAGFSSGVASAVEATGVGNAGGVTISTTNLNLSNGGSVTASNIGIGNAGRVNVTASGDITAEGETSKGFPSGITSFVETGAIGNTGGVTIFTTNLNLTKGGRVDASTSGQGDAGIVDITATESIFINGFVSRFRSGISANALNEDGNGGNVFVRTGNLTIANGGTIEATNFDNIGNDNLPGTGQPGNIFIETDNIDLADEARIEAATQSPTGANGEIDLQVAEDITLQGNSFISARAFGNANGGNLTINAEDGFVFAFPNQNQGDGNDIVANSPSGKDGNITIDAQGVFGLKERSAITGNGTNDIDVSGDYKFINIQPDLAVDIEPSLNIVEPEQITEQVCQGNRATETKNGLVINGKGGVSAPPDQPLTSQNLLINGEVTSAYPIPEPIETSKGKIQLARGIRVTKDGRVILTPYPTNNAGERIPEGRINCGRV